MRQKYIREKTAYWIPEENKELLNILYMNVRDIKNMKKNRMR